MSDAETSTAPRRSQRDRKQASQFVSSTYPGAYTLVWLTCAPIAVDSSQLSKRKRDDEESEVEGSDGEQGDAEEDEPDAEPEYVAPKTVKSKIRASQTAAPAEGDTAAKPPARRGRPPGTGKPRAPKATTSAAAKPRKGRQRKGAAEFDADQVAKETKIPNDNALFSEYSERIANIIAV